MSPPISGSQLSSQRRILGLGIWWLPIPELPPGFFEQHVCLDEISKDVQGDLNLRKHESQPCEARDCHTLKTRHELEVVVRPGPCDSEHGGLFDGLFEVDRLVTAFAHNDARRRGTHEGSFTWKGQHGLKVQGDLHGLTNAGTHRAHNEGRDRPQAFEGCQPCDAAGFMEGRFAGRVTDVGNQPEHEGLKGCEVQGTYRFKVESFEPEGDRERQVTIAGTLEGVCVCECDG